MGVAAAASNTGDILEDCGKRERERERERGRDREEEKERKRENYQEKLKLALKTYNQLTTQFFSQGGWTGLLCAYISTLPIRCLF